MKLRKSILFTFLSIILLAGCNKENIDQKSSDKLNEKKEVLSEQKASENKSVSNTSDDLKLYKIDKVEKLSGKKVSPNFSWNENGKEMSLKDLKGSVVLVNLWATWCGPCIKEMPDLSLLSNELNGKNFRMIGVNVFQQDGSKKVEDFLKTNPVSYTILDGNQEFVDAFSDANGSTIEAIPTTFIIDKDGKIVETIVGGRDKETFLKAINKYMN